MTETPPEPPVPEAASPTDARHPRRRLVIGIIAALGGSAAAIAAVFIFVPTNHKTLDAGPIGVTTPSANTPRPTPTTTPTTPAPSPSTPTSPPPTPTLPPPPSSTQTPTPTRTANPATPTDSDAADEAHIIAGFKHVSDVYFHYMSTSDLDMSMLSDVATGQSYTQFLGAIEGIRAKNEVMKGTPVITNVSVTSRPSATTAIVCATEDDSPTEMVNPDTGAVIDSGFSSYTFGTEMIRAGDNWKAYKPVSSC